MVGMTFQRGMQYPLDRLVRGERGKHRIGIGDMALHANAQRLDALQQLKSIAGRKTRSEVAQASGACRHDERRRTELLVEDNAVISGIGLGQAGEFSGSSPIE